MPGQRGRGGEGREERAEGRPAAEPFLLPPHSSPSLPPFTFSSHPSLLQVDESGHREVVWEMNGETRTIRVPDHKAGVKVKARPKADKADAAQVGAPMPGVAIDIRVKPGQQVKQGEPIVVLSAMKMETVVGAPKAGTVKVVAIAGNDTLEAGDLIAIVE